MGSASLMRSRWKELACRVLFETAGKSHRFPYRLFWRYLMGISRNWVAPIECNLHGRRVLMPANYPYPVVSRQNSLFNAPLIELVSVAQSAVGRPIGLVDVGAAIGDTVLLVDQHCSGMVAEYLCVDGDREFFGYLGVNLRHLNSCKSFCAVLSSSGTPNRDLIRTHSGTASAQGDALVDTVTLDTLLAEECKELHVLKVDADGFDGEVLAGARKLLNTFNPAVLFEWHPKLCEQAGTSPFAAFETLAAHGYQQFVWYQKVGTFAFVSSAKDRASQEQMRYYCLNAKSDYDAHYDVVAVPDWMLADVTRLADLQFARSRLPLS